LNWLKKIAQYYFDHEESEKSVQYSGNDYLAQDLLELFKMEYAISELKRRISLNQRLEFNRRSQHWLNKLEERALELATKQVGPSMLEYCKNWLLFHSGSGFAEELLGWGDGGVNLTNGVVHLGGNFKYDITKDLIEVFLKKNPQFIESYLSDIIDQLNDNNYDNNNGQDIVHMSPTEKETYVRNDIDGLGYDFNGIKEWLSNWGDFEGTVKAILKEKVYPAWRYWWGDQLAVAEKNVGDATQRLEQALGSGNLGHILATINLALNAQHVHGGMFKNMELSEQLMDELSNLDTDRIDEWVNMITGENWKAASGMNWLTKLAGLIPVNDMLDHAYRAITSVLSGDWQVVERRGYPELIRYQWYGRLVMNGASIYQENDRFALLIRGMVRRSQNDMPREFDYDGEQTTNWMSTNTVRVQSFDSREGHPLVRYDIVVAGNIPGRNWEGSKQTVEWTIESGVQVPMYELGRSSDLGDESVVLMTPFEVAEFAKNVIDNAYKDFGDEGEGGGGNDAPEWPYPEGDFDEDPEDARTRGLRLRGNPSPAKNDQVMRVQLPY
jgi:hypothetical protein